jgi:hypothetical protein
METLLLSCFWQGSLETCSLIEGSLAYLVRGAARHIAQPHFPRTMVCLSELSWNAFNVVTQSQNRLLFPPLRLCRACFVAKFGGERPGSKESMLNDLGLKQLSRYRTHLDRSIKNSVSYSIIDVAKETSSSYPN